MHLFKGAPSPSRRPKPDLYLKGSKEGDGTVSDSFGRLFCLPATANGLHNERLPCGSSDKLTQSDQASSRVYLRLRLNHRLHGNNCYFPHHISIFSRDFAFNKGSGSIWRVTVPREIGNRLSNSNVCRRHTMVEAKGGVWKPCLLTLTQVEVLPWRM